MVRFRNAIAAIAFVSLSLSLVTAGSAQTPAVIAPDSLKIVAFGSSSTEGVGASSKAASYPSQLARVLHKLMPDRAVKVINRGIGGEDATDMMKRLNRDVIARKPDLVIWQTGSNDPMTHNPLARFERETRAGIIAMRAAGIEVILMESQWAPHLDKIATTIAYRDIVRKIGEEMHVPVIRRFDLMHDWVKTGLMTKSQMLYADGLHMRDKGYSALAASAAEVVLKSDCFKKHPHAIIAKDSPTVLTRS